MDAQPLEERSLERDYSHGLKAPQITYYCYLLQEEKLSLYLELTVTNQMTKQHPQWWWD